MEMNGTIDLVMDERADLWVQDIFGILYKKLSIYCNFLLAPSNLDATSFRYKVAFNCLSFLDSVTIVD